MVDGRDVFDQLKKNYIKIYENSWKMLQIKDMIVYFIISISKGIISWFRRPK